jgi:GxxExxY protein
VTELLFKKEVYDIVGAAIEVHRELGPGFLEGVYQEALEFELGLQGIPFQAGQHLSIVYKSRTLAKDYIADLVCYQQIIVN